jgi:formylglycine-generating enzyme required for sulfatase activity
MKLQLFLLTLIAVLLFQDVKANGLQANNISLQNQNITNQTWQVRFNLTWNNSWRDGINHDAAWVFIKFRVGNGPWTHAIIDTNGYALGTGTAAVVRVSPERTGAMVYRQNQSSGTFSASAMELRWNYGQNNVQNTDLPQVRVFAIEMVQIPEGPFAIGDGDGNSESYGALGVADNRFYVVTRELSPPLRTDVIFNNGNNILRIKGDGGVDNNGDAVIDNPNYPVGYNSFLIMKYKVTMEQYADFLSTLLPLQAAPRYYNGLGQYKYNIQTSGGLFYTNTPDRVCNFLDFTDHLAYSDWACLRPITETEYEKACRGPIAPVVNEYSWGNTTYSPSYSTSNTTNAPKGNSVQLYISGPENGQEYAVNDFANVYWATRWINQPSTSSTYQHRGNNVYDSNGNLILDLSSSGNYTATFGPHRAGLFVDSLGTITREKSGVTYFGVVEMGVNGTEPLYNVTSTSGRQFSGNHGNGSLDSNGNSNVSGWPTSGWGWKGYQGINTTTSNFPSTGVIERSRVSDRNDMESTYGRNMNTSFRCARSQWW